MCRRIVMQMIHVDNVPLISREMGKRLSIIFLYGMLFSSPAMSTRELFGQSSSNQSPSPESTQDNRVVVSGKQNFENQLLMRELLLLRTHAPLGSHLNLTNAQTDQLQKIEKDYQRQLGELGRKGSLKITERAAKAQVLFGEIEKRLTELFSPDQRKRLRQVAIQSFGNVPGKDESLPVFNMLANSEFRNYMEISSISPDSLQQKLRGEYQKLQQEISKLKRQSNEAILSTLSEVERKRLTDMLGEPFSFGKLLEEKTVEK